jgi:hypothetical protein
VVILLQQHYHRDLLERLHEDAINERTHCHTQKEAIIESLEETVALVRALPLAVRVWLFVVGVLSPFLSSIVVVVR